MGSWRSEEHVEEPEQPDKQDPEAEEESDPATEDDEGKE